MSNFAILDQPITLEEFGGNVDEATPQVPAGTYPAVIVGAKLEVQKKDHNSGKTVLTIQFIDGPVKGLTKDISFNTHYQPYSQEANAVKAREIAKKALYRVAMCVGHSGPLSNLAVLGNKPFLVEFDLQNSDEAREKGWTEFKRPYAIDGSKPYSASGGSTPTQPTATQQPSQPPVSQNPFGGPAAQPTGGNPFGGAPTNQPAGGNPFGGAQAQSAPSGANPFAPTSPPASGGNPFTAGGNPFGGATGGNPFGG